MGFPGSAVNNHPQRQQIIDGLLAGKHLRDIAGQISPPLSHATIHRYAVRFLRPTLANAAAISRVMGSKEIAQPTEPGLAQVAKIGQVTASALASEPILARVEAKYKRLDKSFRIAAEKKDLSAMAAMEQAETAALRFDAQVRCVGGFDPARAAPNATTNMLVVLPQGQEQQQAQLMRAVAELEMGAAPAARPDAIDVESVVIAPDKGDYRK